MEALMFNSLNLKEQKLELFCPLNQRPNSLFINT